LTPAMKTLLALLTLSLMAMANLLLVLGDDL
jgi:hypothetical protein